MPTRAAPDPTPPAETTAESENTPEAQAALIAESTDEATETPTLTATSLPPTATQTSTPTLTLTASATSSPTPSATRTSTTTRTPRPTTTNTPTRTPTSTKAPPTSTINPTVVTSTPSPTPTAQGTPNLLESAQTAIAQVLGLSAIDAEDKPQIVVKTPRGINIRTGPGANYPLVGRGIAQNETAVIQGYARDTEGKKWYYVTPESSRPGWIADGLNGVEVRGDVSQVPLGDIPPTPSIQRPAPTETPSPEKSDA